MDAVNLQWHLIYALVVAGKSARFANGVVARLQRLVPRDAFPIYHLSTRPELLREARTGNYRKLERACRALASAVDIDLRTCSPGQLETVPGIGPKTSRFFIVWTRPEAYVAVIDRHVLRWMRERLPNVPATPPTNVSTYLRLEERFLELAGQLGRTPRELDLEIWGAAATAPNLVPEVTA